MSRNKCIVCNEFIENILESFSVTAGLSNLRIGLVHINCCKGYLKNRKEFEKTKKGDA